MMVLPIESVTMSPMLFLLCACWVALAAALSAKPYDLEDAELYFERFIEQHNKHYFNEAEKQIRFEIFKENLESVNEMNERSNHAVFGITKFMDLTPEEFVSTYTGLRTSINGYDDDDDKPNDYTLFDGDVPNVDAPASFDWREHGVVTRVKDQGSCGGCYAFAATGNIEGQYALKYGKLQEFSEQQIVDCGQMRGCSGGLAFLAFRALIKLGGAVSEVDYPYKAKPGICDFDQSKLKVKLANYNQYNLTSQEKVKQLLYRTGPIAIAVAAHQLHKFTGGIITDEFCGDYPISHAVLLVGYGTENGMDYWIVKNSWGNGDEDGYFRMQRGEGASSCKMMNDHMTSSIIL